MYERMGPIKNNKLANYTVPPYADISDPDHKYIVVDKEAPPVYVIEGLPGNGYNYKDLTPDSEFKNFSLRHDNTSFGFS